jgi:hypothetical protein
MFHRRLARLRALTLLGAFGIGLLGQAIAAVAMPMSMETPQAAVALSGPMADVNGCPACPQKQDAPASPAMAPTCVSGFCTVPPAAVPPGPIVAHPARATFQPIAFHRETGITVRPDLGPPRSILRT